MSTNYLCTTNLLNTPRAAAGEGYPSKIPVTRRSKKMTVSTEMIIDYKFESDSFKNMKLQVQLVANLLTLGIATCNCNQRVSAGSVTTLET